MEHFFDAFSKLNCSEYMKREYEDVMVEKISASQSKKLVFIYCNKYRLLSYKKIRDMEKELYKQVFKRLGFHPQLRIAYPELGHMPLAELVSRVEEDIKEEIRQKDLVNGLEFCKEPFEVEGESLYITCGDSFLTRRRSDGLGDFLHSLFLQRFGKEISIGFHFVEYERKRDWEPELYVVRQEKKEKQQAQREEKGEKPEKIVSSSKPVSGEKPPVAQRTRGQRSSYRRPSNDPGVFYQSASTDLENPYSFTMTSASFTATFLEPLFLTPSGVIFPI